jgi:pimeloyl-ACP methyl ester carboxylesterase
MLTLFALATASWGTENSGVRIQCPPGPVAATEDAKWRIPIRVFNDLEVGLLPDSLSCVVDDLDPGITGAGRRAQGTSTAITQVMKPLGQRDSTTVTFTGLASCERARLTFRLFAHNSQGAPYEATSHVETGPSLIARSFPSNFIDDQGRRIETVFIAERWPQRLSPAILLIHPEGSHARRMIPVAWNLSSAGYTIMMVSLPGYGQSTGPSDFAGPASVRALGLALDALRKSPQVDPSRIAVWGISRGATAAALLAAQRKDITALVLQSGVFDPASAYRATRSDSLRHALDHEGKSNGGWNARSALRVANRIQTPVLFVHGDRDSEVVSNQAVDLAGKLRAAGGEVQVQVLPGVGHAVPSSLSYPLVTAFLKPYLKPAR